MAVTRTLAPISKDEFANALYAIWRDRRGSYRPRTIGLAVSGGVDSMAMAYLCSTQRSQGLELRAFIVDHKLREGSAAEARTVRSNLRSLGKRVIVYALLPGQSGRLIRVNTGIPSTILTLDWSERSPARSRLETDAREKRFRALGLASRHYRIDSLLFGHHADDQAETVLLRIVQGYTGQGLHGVKPIAPINGCHGIWGVHNGAMQTMKIKTSTDHDLAQMATAGVQLYRPLLKFSKDRLVATCTTNGVSWEEDETNRDPSLTNRNVVRQMLGDSSLPNALSGPNLLAIASTVSKRDQEDETRITDLIQRFFRIRLCSTNAALVVNLVMPSVLRSIGPNLGELKSTEENLLARLLRRLTLLVSHRETVLESQLGKPLIQLQQTIDETSCESGSVKLQASNVNAGGARWLLKRDERAGRTYPLIWTITREHLGSTDSIEGSACEWVAEERLRSLGNGTVFWKWQLWDNRFWIRVRSRHRHRRIIARFCTADELSLYQERLGREARANFQDRLRMMAPGRMRRALVGLSVGVTGRVFAFPSLNSVLDQECMDIQWEMKWKPVGSVPNLKIVSTVKGGTFSDS